MKNIMILFVLILLQTQSVYACDEGVGSSIPSYAEQEGFAALMEASRLAKVVQSEPPCAEQEGLTELMEESRKRCIVGAACVICTGVVSTVVIAVTIAFSYYSAAIFGDS